MATEQSPSGCRWCGLDKYGHARRWSSAVSEGDHQVGWHQYTAPTEDQIKARMLARRATREHWGPIQLEDGSTTYGLTVDPSADPETHERLMREQGITTD